MRMTLYKFQCIDAGYANIYRTLLRHCVAYLGKESAFLGADIFSGQRIKRQTHHIVHTMLTGAALGVFLQQLLKSYLNYTFH